MKTLKLISKTNIGAEALIKIDKKYSKWHYKIALKKLKMKMYLSIDQPISIFVEYHDPRFNLLHQFPAEASQKFIKLLQKVQSEIQEEMNSLGAKKNIDYCMEFDKW